MEINSDSITLRKEFADDSVSEMNTTARTYPIIQPEFEMATQIQTRRTDLYKFIRIYESNLYTARVLERVTVARYTVIELGKSPEF